MYLKSCSLNDDHDKTEVLLTSFIRIQNQIQSQVIPTDIENVNGHSLARILVILNNRCWIISIIMSAIILQCSKMKVLDSLTALDIKNLSTQI